MDDDEDNEDDDECSDSGDDFGTGRDYVSDGEENGSISMMPFM